MAWSKSMVPKEKQMMLDHDIPYFQITILGYFGCPSFLDPLSSDCWLSHDHKLVSLSHCCPSSSHSHLGLLWFNLYIYICVLCIYIYIAPPQYYTTLCFPLNFSIWLLLHGPYHPVSSSIHWNARLTTAQQGGFREALVIALMPVGSRSGPG